jgi:DNA-binding transcriptional LysR family regulator
VAQDMVAVPLGPRQRSAIVASPGFFERHRKPVVPQELRELPCILLRFSDGRLYHWEFERGGVEVAIEVEGALTLDDQGLAIEAALDGAGIAYAFEAQVSALVANHRLVRVLEDWCPYYPGFYLYYPSRRQMPAVLRAFVEHLQSASRV